MDLGFSCELIPGFNPTTAADSISLKFCSADNIVLDAGSGGATLATEDVSTVHHQKVKVEFGGDGVATLVQASAPLPVEISDGTDTALVDGSGNLQVIAAANSGVDIGDVDVLSVIPGTGATNLGKALDSAVGATDTGVLMLGVRRDADTSLVNATNDLAPFLVDANGYLKVEIFDGGDSHTIDGTVTVTHPAIGGGTEATAQRVTIANDSTGTLTVDGTVSVTHPALGGGTEAGAQRVTIANDSTGLLSVDDNNASLTVDAPVGTPVNVQIGDGTDTALVSTAGALLIEEDNFISTNNSTTATLGISGNFTGTGDDVSDYASITVQTDSSHDSAASGMTFEFSTDNTNWDDAYAFTYTAADGARRFQFPVTAQYFRVNYTNGGTGQTHFRLQTILHSRPVTSSVHRVVDNVDVDRSATLTKTVILAQSGGSGDFIPVAASAGGNFRVDLEELAGTATSVNNGAADAGTLRVTIASDSTGQITVGGDATDGAAHGASQTGFRSMGTDGTNDQQISVNATGHVNIADGGNDISIDWAGTAPPIGAGTEAAALRVTMATDSTGQMTIDGTVTANAGTGDFLSIAGHTANEAFKEAMAIGGMMDDAATTLATEGNVSAVRITAERALMVNLRTEADAEIGTVASPLIVTDDGSAILVDGSGVTQPVSGTVTVTHPALGGGTEAGAQRVTIANDSTGVLSIDDGGGDISVDWAGTAPPIGAGTEAAALRVTLATDSTGQVTIDGTVTASNTAGDVAHNGVDSGNPVKIGAQARTTWQAAAADADRVNLVADDLGRVINWPYAPRDLIVHNRITLTTTTETTLIALDATHFHDLIGLYCSNESATEVRIDFRDATAGTVRFSIDLAADGGGAVVNFPAPLTQSAVNNNWTAQLSTGVSTVYITGIAAKTLA
jgi:hypothetical protein